ncbi:MAG: isopenicillin N synthase family dioxygenase [Solirubrobacteraceae bacterium]
MLEVIEIGPLFGSGPERDQVDALVGAAASTVGVLLVGGPADVVPSGAATRERMLRVFALAPDEQHALWRQSYAPGNAAVYRGWSPRGGEIAVDIYDLGPDVAHARRAASDDPLLGLTPLPPRALLPGWQEAVSDYYRAMERVGVVLLRSLARWLGLGETVFDAAFVEGISTLRLMRYELAPEAAGAGSPARPGRGEHVDSGFVTLLAQHGQGGLQAQTREGEWIEVPALDEAIVVNFGALLERWTSGRVRATPHRVISAAPTRYSIPFFFEARVDAVIAPLPLADAVPFEPFSYGDHLWAAMSAFPNFVDIADLRTPRGIAAA